MKPLRALFIMSVRQSLPLRRTIALLLIQLAPAGIYVLTTASRTPEAGLKALVEVGAAAMFALTTPVVAIVIGGSAFGVERRDQTLSFIALRPISRMALAATKTSAAITAAFAINLVGAVALGIAHASRFGSPGVIIGLSIGTFVATAIYVSVTVPLGFLTDRAVIIGMAYLFLFENGAALALPGLATMSPWRIGFASFAATIDQTLIVTFDLVESLDLSITKGLVSLLIAFVVGVALTTQMLRSRDLA